MLTISFTGFSKQNGDEQYLLTEYPSFSTDNEYIPIQALSDGTLYSTTKNKTLFYNLETLNRARMVGYRKYEDFCGVLLAGTRWVRLSHRASILRDVDGSENLYAALANTLVTFDYVTGKCKPLMVLTVRREEMFSINRANPDPSQFCLVIDKSFLEDELNFKVFRNVKKHYIDEITKQVDVLYTSNLAKLCYNDRVFTPKARTIAELIEHYKSINDILLESVKQGD